MSHIHLTKDELLESRLLITALLSDKFETSQKYDILENEYNIVLNDDLRKDVDVMCNLGQGIEDRTNEKFIWNMYQEGYTLEQIAKVAETSVDEVEKVIKKKEKYALV